MKKFIRTAIKTLAVSLCVPLMLAGCGASSSGTTQSSAAAGWNS